MMEDNLRKNAENVCNAWDEAFATNNMDALLALYTPDAIIESPLVAHLLERKDGVCKGHDELRVLLDVISMRKPKERKFHKKNFFTDGKTVIWEYPRTTEDGEQMDFVEVIELEGSLIKYHRVYWGWMGVNMLKYDEFWNLEEPR